MKCCCRARRRRRCVRIKNRRPIFCRLKGKQAGINILWIRTTRATWCIWKSQGRLPWIGSRRVCCRSSGNVWWAMRRCCTVVIVAMASSSISLLVIGSSVKHLISLAVVSITVVSSWPIRVFEFFAAFADNWIGPGIHVASIKLPSVGRHLNGVSGNILWYRPVIKCVEDLGWMFECATVYIYADMGWRHTFGLGVLVDRNKDTSTHSQTHLRIPNAWHARRLSLLFSTYRFENTWRPYEESFAISVIIVCSAMELRLDDRSCVCRMKYSVESPRSLHGQHVRKSRTRSAVLHTTFLSPEHMTSWYWLERAGK